MSSILPSTGTGRLAGAIKSQSTSDLASMAMKASYPIVFLHLGREGAAPVTLYCSTSSSRRQLVDKIEKQRQTLTQEQIVFRLVNINSRYFSGLNRVRCVSILCKWFLGSFPGCIACLLISQRLTSHFSLVLCCPLNQPTVR